MGSKEVGLDKKITQYFSKHKKCWVYFTDKQGNKITPNIGEINEYKKYKYKLK